MRIPGAAADIVLDNGGPGVPTRAYQRCMVGEIVKLPGTEEPGEPVEAGDARTVQVLPGSTSTPAISAEPMGAWTRAVCGAAKAYGQ